MRIAVMGTGAMGLYMAARLASSGNDVTCIARGRQLEALREKGLRLQSPLGDVAIHPIAANPDPAEVGQVEAVLFCVKLGDAAVAARAIRPLLGDETAVITFQNGIDAADIVAAEIGESHVLPGSANVAGADVPEPGLVRHLGRYTRASFLVNSMGADRLARCVLPKLSRRQGAIFTSPKTSLPSYGGNSFYWRQPAGRSPHAAHRWERCGKTQR